MRGSPEMRSRSIRAWSWNAGMSGYGFVLIASTTSCSVGNASWNASIAASGFFRSASLPTSNATTNTVARVGSPHAARSAVTRGTNTACG